MSRAIGERCAEIVEGIDPAGCVSLEEEREGQRAAVAWASDGVRELAVGLGRTRTEAATNLLRALRGRS